jgi:hypothetical protein
MADRSQRAGARSIDLDRHHWHRLPALAPDPPLQAGEPICSLIDPDGLLENCS